MAPFHRPSLESETATVTSPLASQKVVRNTPLVSFNNTVILHWTNSYSKEDLNAAWYSEAEFQNIKSKIKKTLLLMEACSPKANSKGRCTRGLESVTPDGRRQKQKRRLDAKNAVLDEQEFQKEVGIPDPDLLADLCFEETRVSRAIAISMGCADAEEVLSHKKRRPRQMPSPKLKHSISRTGSIRMLEREDSIRKFSTRAA